MLGDRCFPEDEHLVGSDGTGHDTSGWTKRPETPEVS